MKTSSSKLLTALVKRYEAQIAEGEATLQVYLTNAAGIGEHSQIVNEMDKQAEQIAAAEDRLLAITKFIANNKDETLTQLG